MKAGKSSDTAVVLPSVSTNSLARAKVTSSVAMPRIISTSSITGTGFMKCKPDEALRAVGGGGEPGDGDRRGVGGDDGVGLEERTKRHEDLALHRLVLGRRLDHQIGVGEALIALGIGDAGERLLALLLGDLARGDLAGEVLVDGLERLVDPLLRQVAEHDVVA